MTTPRRASQQSTSPYTHEPKPQQEREDGNLPQYNSNGHAVTRGIQPNGESGRKWFHPYHFLRVCWASSCTASKYVNILWPFVPAAIALVRIPSSVPYRFYLVDAMVLALRQARATPVDLHPVLCRHGPLGKLDRLRGPRTGQEASNRPRRCSRDHIGIPR